MIIEIGENTQLKNSPFKSEAWLKGLNTPYRIFKAISSNNEVASVALNITTLSKAKLFKIQTLTTPLWALDCGLNKDLNEKVYSELFSEISNDKSHLKVIDLPPSIPRGLVINHTPKDFIIQWRHTRQLMLPAELPSNRRKQIRRAERDGIVAALDNSNVLAVTQLHEESRSRKSINHENDLFSGLIDNLSTQSDFFIVTAKDENDNLMASGGFLIIDSKTCLYAFGGQKRSKKSGLATVALINHAMDVAYSKGCEVFDFGGSADLGVDKFYAEFGATKVEKARLIQLKPWLKPVLKFVRPDLV